MHEVFFRIVLFTTAALPAMSSPIYSSQTLYIMIPTGCSSNCINSPGGNSLTYNFTNANNGQAASVTGSSFYATNGFDLGARTSSTLNNASAGQYDVLGQIAAHDTISIAGVSPGVHNIQFTYHLDGSFAFPNPAVGGEQLQLRGRLTSGLNGPFLAGQQGARAFDSSGQALTGTPEPATLSMGFLGLMVGFARKVRRILKP
ncbi:MAG: hypothetical protein EXQ52_07965 [Bryobacterales bacterium]|nr:hypothetical protein [Bryobacterales bacterium]